MAPHALRSFMFITVFIVCFFVHTALSFIQYDRLALLEIRSLVMLYVILLSVCRLLRRCCLPSVENFPTLKQFGACDNKHFDFDLNLVSRNL